MTTQELWQSQTVDAPRITTAYLRERASDTVRNARRRNLGEYVASAVGVAVAIVAWFHAADLWASAGNAWMILALGTFAWRWRRLATPATLPADLGAVDTLHFHRRELERQYSARKHAWRWVVPLFVPAWALLVCGQIFHSEATARQAVTFSIPLFVFTIGLVIWKSESRARKLQREIELLDLMVK